MGFELASKKNNNNKTKQSGMLLEKEKKIAERELGSLTWNIYLGREKLWWDLYGMALLGSDSQVTLECMSP